MTAGALVQGTAVAYRGKGLLILGRPRTGKSALALEMIALGAGLIGDDLVRIDVEGGRLIAAPADRGDQVLIEARGVGLLRLPSAGAAPLCLVLDLDEPETDRLPERRFWRRLGVETQLLRRPSPLSPAAILLACGAGGPEDPEQPLDALLRRTAVRKKLTLPGAESEVDR
ncbi:MAG: serine kinase [Paracoccaceae bacterium]